MFGNPQIIGEILHAEQERDDAVNAEWRFLVGWCSVA